MAGIISRPVSSLFNGQADIVIGKTELTNYATNTLASITDFVSVGQVVEDTTDFTGDEATVDNILDEQGNVITTDATQGTIAFTFSMANFSANAIEFFLNGDNIDVSSITPDYISASSAIGFGHKTGTMTRPVGIINAQANKMLILPKANIVSSLGFEGNLMVINCTVTAESVDEANLKTAMIVDGPVQYDNNTGSPFSQASMSIDNLSDQISPATANTTTKASKSSTL